MEEEKEKKERRKKLGPRSTLGPMKYPCLLSQLNEQTRGYAQRWSDKTLYTPALT